MSDQGLAASYQRIVARRAAILAGGLGLLLISFTLDVATGPAFLPVSEVIRSLAGDSPSRSVDAIVWTIRLPVALLAVAIGAALGLTGAVMQTILNNPLASSYTLGISAGAGFGAALVIVLGIAMPWLGDEAIPVAAFVFAGLTSAGVIAIGQRRGSTSEILVLAGIALLFLFQALLSLLQFIASPEALQQIVFWLFGSLQKATWAKALIVLGVIGALVPVMVMDVWRLTVLKLGDERARGLGVDVAGLRLRAFVLISLLTGVAVAFAGTIGFIGLVAPHVARMLLGEDQRAFLPGSALAGALLLSAASITSKMVLPGAIVPIGIVTALIGVPFFVWLIVSQRRTYW